MVDRKSQDFVFDNGALVYYHSDGITPEHFVHFEELTRRVRILAYSRDMKGQQFVSAIEDKQYPFYGVQFHPAYP